MLALVDRRSSRQSLATVVIGAREWRAGQRAARGDAAAILLVDPTVVGDVASAPLAATAGCCGRHIRRDIGACRRALRPC
jgi:hypothetical protein